MKERKEYDQKYRKSRKGKKAQKKWNKWRLNKGYYKEDICGSCNKFKPIVSKGNCDSCR